MNGDGLTDRALLLHEEPIQVIRQDEAGELAPELLNSHGAAFHVICLGSGGGPSEDNVTGLLLRPVDGGAEWKPASVLALDAGSHLAPIVRIMERYFPVESGGIGGDLRRNGASNGHASTSPEAAPGDVAERAVQRCTVLQSGPFSGLHLSHESARANARHILHTHIAAYLITHPHLDHLSALAINTAGFPPPDPEAGIRPKVIAGTTATVDAIKKHIFNDVIWPNLTDEEGGVGFVTLKRLNEGGEHSSLHLSPKTDTIPDDDDGKNYVELVDGMSAKGLKCSHGVRVGKGPIDQRHRGSIVGLPPPTMMKEVAKEERRRQSKEGDHAHHQHHHHHHRQPHHAHHPKSSLGSAPTTPDEPDEIPNPNGTLHPSPTSPLYQDFSHFAQQVYAHPVPALPSPPLISPTNKHLHIEATSPTPTGSASSAPTAAAAAQACVVDSTAFFLRTTAAPHRELLFFGDVEPDSLSLYPRNHLIWREAAGKHVKGALSGVIIECSFEDAVSDEVLFGHLCPRHLIAELQTLASFVNEEKRHVKEVGNDRVASAESSGSERRLKRKRSAPLPNGSLRRRQRDSPIELDRRADEAEEIEGKKRSRSLAERSGARFGEVRRGSVPENGHNIPHDRLHHHGIFWANKPRPGQDSTAISPRSSFIAKPVHTSNPPPTNAADAEDESDETVTSPTVAQPVQPPSHSHDAMDSPPPLAGLKILIIHVKDTLKDGPHVSRTILRQLHEHERRLEDDGGGGLGCEFIVSESGESYWM